MFIEKDNQTKIRTTIYDNDFIDWIQPNKKIFVRSLDMIQGLFEFAKITNRKDPCSLKKKIILN